MYSVQLAPRGQANSLEYSISLAFNSGLVQSSKLSYIKHLYSRGLEAQELESGFSLTLINLGKTFQDSTEGFSTFKVPFKFPF